MSDISIEVCQDRINNPFYEVRISLDSKSAARLQTAQVVRMAQKAEPLVDKIVIFLGRLRDEVLLKIPRCGVIGWERSPLQEGIEANIKKRVWKSCQELGVSHE